MTERYLEGLASYSVVFTQAAPGTKRTMRVWDYYENLHEMRGGSRLDLVDEWLRKGSPVGYLLRNRLAAVDADAPETVQRITDFEEGQVFIHFPKVNTPSDGIHAHFEHPPGIDMIRMKNHVCHPLEEGKKVPWDFKLGDRTMLMAPGTVMSKGRYDAGIWLPPPILDVHHLAPELEIYREDREFLRDTRPHRDRVNAAMSYLKLHAPVSVQGRGRRNALRGVAEHIVGFYDLDPSLAFYLMTVTKSGTTRNGESTIHVAWNDRCITGEGKPSPWSDEALWQALEDAVDAAPAYGVILMDKAKEKAFARWSAAAFIEILTHLREPEGHLWIKADPLYRAFLEWSGVEPEAFAKCELGNEIRVAVEQGRLPFVFPDRTNADGRIYRGLDLNMLRHAIDTHEQRQRLIDLAC